MFCFQLRKRNELKSDASVSFVFSNKSVCVGKQKLALSFCNVASYIPAIVCSLRQIVLILPSDAFELTLLMLRSDAVCFEFPTRRNSKHYCLCMLLIVAKKKKNSTRGGAAVSQASHVSA